MGGPLQIPEIPIKNANHFQISYAKLLGGGSPPPLLIEIDLNHQSLDLTFQVESQGKKWVSLKNLQTPGITWAVFFSLGQFLYPNAWYHTRAKNCLKMKVGNLGRTQGSLKGCWFKWRNKSSQIYFFWAIYMENIWPNGIIFHQPRLP